jgi:hypothetical protein
MAPYTADAGIITFPCGTIEPGDINAGAVDLMGHIHREIAEETGLHPDELECEPGWSVVRNRGFLALLKRFSSNQSANELRVRINRFLECETRREFLGVRIVCERADLHPRMTDEEIHSGISGA